MSSRADPRAEKVSGLSSKVQNILNILKTSQYPTWFEQNVTWVKNNQITQDEFISAFDYYQKDKGKISTNMDNVIKELENKNKLAAKNYIGEIEKRHVKSQDFLNKWKVKPGDVKKA